MVNETLPALVELKKEGVVKQDVYKRQDEEYEINGLYHKMECFDVFVC